jgi:hypothetical protein
LYFQSKLSLKSFCHLGTLYFLQETLLHPVASILLSKSYFLYPVRHPLAMFFY